MDLKTLAAVKAFLEQIPKKLRERGRELIHGFDLTHREFGVSAELVDPRGDIFALEIRFDPQTSTIASCSCDCKTGKSGAICIHLTGLAIKLSEYIPWGFSGDSLKNLERLDSLLNAADLHEPLIRLSIHIQKDDGTLVPEIKVHRLIKSGEYSTGKKFTANDTYKIGQGNPQDQILLEYLKNFRQIIFYSNYEVEKRFPWSFWVSLIGHPRVFFQGEHISIENGVLRCEFEPTEIEDEFVLTVGPKTLGGSTTQMYAIDGGALFHSPEQNRLVLCHVDPFRLEIVKEIASGCLHLDRPSLFMNLSRIERLQTLFDLRFPDIIEEMMLEAQPKLVVLLDMTVGQGLSVKPRLFYREADLRVLPGAAGRYLPGKNQIVMVRKESLETELFQAFISGFPREFGTLRDGEVRISDLESAFQAIDWFKARSDLTIEWLRHEPKIHRPKHPPNLHIHIDPEAHLKIHLYTQSEQFSLAGFPKDEGPGDGAAFVPVGQGEWLQIDAELRKQLNRLRLAIHFENDELRLKETGLGLLARMDRISWEGDQAWRDKIEKWSQLDLGDAQPNPDLKAKLRKYQLDGYRWLQKMSTLSLGVCLADDMGLGKTVQALAVLLDRTTEGPALVVTPASVVFNWKEEIEKFTPTLNPVLYSESGRGKNLAKFSGRDVVIISYALVLRDIEKLRKRTWGTLILDEAQFIKNALSQTAVAVGQLKRRWTLALTGTPLENHLGDLWSVFRMIAPDVLGDWAGFRKRFVAPLEKNQDSDRLETLKLLIQPFVLRRTKSAVLSDLPKRSEIIVKVEMTDAQRKRYEQERTRILDQLDQSEENRRMRLLTGILRLRQLTCHPVLVDPKSKAESAKLRLFSHLIEELVHESHRVLVFSQFTSFLEIVARELNRIHIAHVTLTGDTPVKHRPGIIRRFQKDEVPVFLVSLRAGGTGINLTHANYVIHLDPWWNPAVENQATDRAHRIGQTQAVTVYHLITTQTIEESIVHLHDRKKELIEGILADQDEASKLSAEDLIALIRDHHG